MVYTQKKTILRFALIFFILLIGFVFVIGKIIKTQTIDKNLWLPYAQNQVSQNHQIPQQRGNIYDIKGRLLVGSIPEYEIYLDTRVPSLRENDGELWKKHVDSLAITLNKVLKRHSAKEYKQILNDAYRRKDGRLRLYPTRISFMQRQALFENALIKMGRNKSGVWFENKYIRERPYGNLDGRTIGSINRETGEGVSGLEKYYDSWLSGEPGEAMRRNVEGRKDDVILKWPKNGVDVVATLNADMMEIVEIALSQRLKKTQAEWGCCVLMEVKSGEVRAISNLKKYDDNQYYEGVNYAARRVEPGSTFKTVSLMVALDDGKISLNDTFEVSKKGWQYMDALHTDSHPLDTIYTARSATAVSSNIAFAKMITYAYEGSANKFVKRLKKIGLTDEVEWEIPGSQQANITSPKDVVTLSRMAYGYAVELTPLEIIMFYNAIANDGKMVQPIFAKRIEDRGKAIKSFSTHTLHSSICRSSTLRDVKLALHDVVWDDRLGTASKTPWGEKKVQSDLVAIAGKTGTAQVLENGKYNPKKHRITFVGYFPEENPQYTCLCMMEAPQGYYDSGMDCGYVVRQIAEYIMAYKK